uniref:Uncharacterized protein n=1 Tax=Meloidogyne incognita TaxID=6306 RepID=A0A914LV31_MELIC
MFCCYRRPMYCSEDFGGRCHNIKEENGNWKNAFDSNQIKGCLYKIRYDMLASRDS